MLHPTDGEVPVTAEEAPALEQGDGLVKTSAGELFGAHSALKEREAAALVERGEEVVGAEKAAALVEVEAKDGAATEQVTTNLGALAVAELTKNGVFSSYAPEGIARTPGSDKDVLTVVNSDVQLNKHLLEGRGMKTVCFNDNSEQIGIKKKDGDNFHDATAASVCPSIIAASDFKKYYEDAVAAC